MTENGSLYAWGSNHLGQLGLGVGEDVARPTRVDGLQDIVSAFGNGMNGYALDAEGKVRSWGLNEYGLLGVGEIDGLDDEMLHRHHRAAGVSGYLETRGCARPAVIEDLPDIRQLACGNENVFALDGDGRVWAWGHHDGLGRAARKDSNRPQRIAVLDGIVSIHAHNEGHAFYAIDANGDVWSWGNGWEGELGHGKRRNQAVPARVPTLDRVTAVVPVPGGAFALVDGGKVVAWGSGTLDHGVIPRDRRKYLTEPQALDVPEPLAELYAGGGLVVARTAAGETYTWGGSTGLRLCDDAEPSRQAVRSPSIDGWTCWSLSGSFGLAANEVGALVSFGENDCGALGTGEMEACIGPTVIEGIGSVIATHACVDQSFAICSE